MNPTQIPCDFCGTLVAIPDDWPVDWAVCKSCQDADTTYSLPITNRPER